MVLILELLRPIVIHYNFIIIRLQINNKVFANAPAIKYHLPGIKTTAASAIPHSVPSVPQAATQSVSAANGKTPPHTLPSGG